MSNILEENLKEIKRYDAKLTEELTSISQLLQNLSLCETQIKEPNLSINGSPVHSQEGAEKEAKEIFQKSEDNANYIHVIFGLGLGYLFKEFCDNAQGTVILYEPNKEVLRVTLEMVDFSKELSKKNVLVSSDLESIEKILYERYTYGCKLKCHFLNYHRQNQPQQIEILIKELTRFNSILTSNFNFQKKNNYSFLQTTLTAFNRRTEGKPLAVLKDKFKDIPAIIVSAGPSLSKNIQFLKENQDKALIFCVGTAFKALVEAGIKPDFLHAIEMYDCTAQINKYDLSGINFVSEGYTNPEFHRLKYKNKFFTLSRENIANVWLADILGVDSSIYETKGTVSYNALFSAHLLGCNPLILIGQDLAYSEGKCYAGGSAYGNLKCVIDKETNKPKVIPENLEEYRVASFGTESKLSIEQQNEILENRLKDLNSSIMFVKGQKGEMLPTEQGYALFIEYFKDFAKRYKDEKVLINSSIGGAQIDGFNNVDLSEIFRILTTSKPNVDDEIDNTDYELDLKLMYENLTNEANLIEETITIIKNGQVDLRNLKRELQRHRQLTPNASKYLKNCLDSFMAIITGPKERSYIVTSISRDEEAQLSWLLKEKDGKYDINTQMEILKALEDYFYNNDKKFTETREKIIDNLYHLDIRIKDLIKL